MASNWSVKKLQSSDLGHQYLKHGMTAAPIAVVMPLQLIT